MTAADDNPSAMNHEPNDQKPTKKFSDTEVDALLQGGPTPEGGESVASLLNEIRATSKPVAEVRGELGGFLSDRPTAPPYIDEVALAPIVDLSERRLPLLQRPLARISMVAGIGLFGLTGAHAAGALDVPFFPDTGQQSAVVAAQPEPDVSPAPTAEGTAPASQEPEDGSTGSAASGEIGATLGYGDLSMSVAVESAPDGYIITLDVEGVSEACEAAIESLSGPVSFESFKTDMDEFDALARNIEETCGSELDELMPSLDDPESLEHFLEGFEFELDLPDDLEGLEGLFGNEFEMFGGGFLEGFELDPDDLGKFFEDFDPEDLDKFFGGSGFDFGFGFDPENLEGFQLDPGELDGLFGDLGGLLDGFGIDPDSFDGFQLNPEDLDKFFEEFDPDDFGKFFEDLDPEQLDQEEVGTA